MEGMIGEIKMFAGNFAPRSWALCDGQLLSISQNTALFSILGTTYGGDGRTTFGLPDLRGRLAMHPGNGPGLSSRRLGEKGGSESNVITQNQLPAHTHAATLEVEASVKVNNSDGEDNVPAGNFLAKEASGDSYIDSAGSNQELNGVDATGSVQIGNTGGSQPVNNVPPFECVNYIICMEGIFPSRS